MQKNSENHETPAIGNVLLCDVPALMKQYFANKDEKKKIKIERQEYMANNVCLNKGKSDGISIRYTGCIEDELEHCSVCKERHNFYLRLKKLSGANTGIMLKVRSAVARHIA